MENTKLHCFFCKSLSGQVMFDEDASAALVRGYTTAVMNFIKKVFKRGTDIPKYAGRGQEFKYWQRFVERTKDSHVNIKVFKPLTGTKYLARRTNWYYNEHRPWTRESLMKNRVNERPPKVYVEPIKEWQLFLGDRRKLSTMAEQGFEAEEGILLGIGNALLDMTVVTDTNFLKRFDLLPNNAIIAGEKQKQLYHDMLEEFEPSYLPGGATQNSIRVAQWLLGTPKATTFLGSVGNDKFGEILLSTAEEVGVNVRYHVDDSLSTGRCGAVITGEDRSLVTELGAAEHFEAAFLDESENWKLVEKARYFYIGGFFLPVSMDSVMKLAKHVAEKDKTIIMNLHATFLCQYFVNADLHLMQYVDVLFGNGDEAQEFAKEMKFGTQDIKEIALKTAQLPKLNKSRERIVVFTQGKDPTIIAQGGHVTEHKINPIEPKLIKDTNGCGDAFVGGFLSQLALGRPVVDCLRCGFYASKVVIQYFGCNYPDHPDFKA